jgi:hypothetical protein
MKREHEKKQLRKVLNSVRYDLDFYPFLDAEAITLEIGASLGNST